MYLQVLFGLAALLALALGGLQVAVSLAAAAERHAAARYADVALERARGELVGQIAAQVESGSPDGPFTLPPPASPLPLCAVAPSATPGPCPFSVRTSVELLGQTGAGGDPNELARAVQRAPGAHENRLAATLAATVFSPAGVIIRRRTMVLRTYPVAPFASDDGSDAPVAGAPVSGDSAGSCDGRAGCGADTRIRAKLTCRDRLDPARCAGVPDRYVDRFEDENWHNAHAAPNAWSP